MKINLRDTRKLLIFCVIFLILPNITLGQPEEINLVDKKITIKMEKKPLGEVFKYLMKNYDILIGFEGSNSDMGHSDYAFDTNLSRTETTELKSKDGLRAKITAENVFLARNHLITVIAENKRLKEVFDTIVQQMKYYDWEIKEDVVNIFPKKGRDLRLKKLLETNINSFKFEKGDTIWQITTKIKELPEINKFVNENNFYFSGKRTGLVSILESQYGRKIDVEMDFSNITFKELLNKITKIKRGGWIIENHGFSKTVQKEYIVIDI